MNNLFNGIFNTSVETISIKDFMLCVVVSLAIGAFLSTVYSYKNKYTQSFVITLALIPAIVCVIIMMVNGNVGAGVAVAGAFSLIRFRSQPGTASEIGAIFIAMCAGITAGMGYLAFAVLFTVVLCAVWVLYNKLDAWKKKSDDKEKTLHITIPENLDYSGAFDDLMDEFTVKHELVNVKTTNLGSLFKLTYHVELKDAAQEKAFIDKLRCRNGNLEIVLSKKSYNQTTL